MTITRVNKEYLTLKNIEINIMNFILKTIEDLVDIKVEMMNFLIVIIILIEIEKKEKYRDKNKMIKTGMISNKIIC